MTASFTPGPDNSYQVAFTINGIPPEALTWSLLGAYEDEEPEEWVGFPQGEPVTAPGTITYEREVTYGGTYYLTWKLYDVDFNSIGSSMGQDEVYEVIGTAKLASAPTESDPIPDAVSIAVYKI